MNLKSNVIPISELNIKMYMGKYFKIIYFSVSTKQYMDISIRHLRFFLLYISYKTTFFSKKYFKAISGQIFMKFISRHAEFFEFYLFI
jgi:hypothetical protein